MVQSLEKPLGNQRVNVIQRTHIGVVLALGVKNMKNFVDHIEQPHGALTSKPDDL